ncbi:MAG: efflux RND transporter periplasmic adaptor subunit [Victivallaceae bacterium]|nr:efflux RND transporter periplasmic adaptor subunit [Victivallaceae bacterium]MDD4181325.1 efflux RND transporter periplasmic adaptor subunit [Victivallaceae bacterium]
MKWKKLFLGFGEILVGGAILAGAIVFYYQTGGERKITARRQSETAPIVILGIIKGQILQSRVEGIGTGLAKESVDVTANATELVVGLHFEDGQTVEKGKLLVQLRDDQYQAELRQMKLNLEEQERELKRLSTLYNANIISQKDYDTAQTAVARAKTRIDIVEYQIKNRKILAPFSGKLGMRKISIGDLVSPTTIITTVDDISEIKVDFRVSEKYYPLIKVGQKVGVTSVAYPGKIFDGVIRAISPRIDTITRTVEVRATVPNQESKLMPGMLFIVELELGTRYALMIPEKAIMSLGEIQYVFVYQPETKTVARREVNLGQRDRGSVEVSSGLLEGDVIVTDGVLKLVDGSAVTVSGTAAEIVLTESGQSTSQNSAEGSSK